MKTQYYKQFLLVFILIAFTLIFKSCESQDETIHNHEVEQEIAKSIIKNVTLNEVPNVAQYLQNNIARNFKVSLKVSEIFNTREPDVSITIKTDEIKQVTDNNEISNYSFAAKYEETNQETSIINFVVSEKYDSSMYSYIIIYKPNIIWFEANNRILNMNDYTGEIIYFNYDGSYVGKTFLLNGLIINSATRGPCDDDGNGTGGGSGGGSPGGGSTGGSGGGSTGGGSTGGGSTGGTGGSGGTTTGTAFCTCAGHAFGNPDCTCDEWEIIIIITLISDPAIIDLLQRGPCDGDVIIDPCDSSQADSIPCENDEIAIFMSSDCAIANSLEISCSDLLAFEQDYKTRMSAEELLIFDSISRVKQLSYLANAQLATWKSEELYPNSIYNGKGDAFRHAYWNALNVIDLGLALTEALTSAHEEKPPTYPYNYKEKEMDLYNNQIGRYRADFPSDGYSTLEQSIQFAINTGALKYLNNLASDGKATSLSTLIPTNE